MPPANRQKLVALCTDVIGPMIRADGGVLYLVGVDDDKLVLHLGGLCSGCPGAPLTVKFVIEPAVRSIGSQIALTVTNGAMVPEGAFVVGEAVSANEIVERL